MSTRLFSSKLTGILDQIGCYPVSGQEYKLQHNFGDFQFMVRKGDYDKGYMKLVIIEGFMQQGYARVEFSQTAEDRKATAASTTHDFFTAKVRYI